MLALLFPGQGSQEVGMGRDVHAASPAAREVFALADATLGFSLSRLCFEGPEDELRRTEVQQPNILATSVALLRALSERAVPQPAFVAGHSLGEYTALVAAGALDLEDTLRLVHLRGRLMQEAVADGKGAMAAILGCSAEVVERACARAREDTGRVVTPANYNGPAQTVIAGEALAVEYACARAKEAGAKRAVPLAVSAPFHCPLMEPAAAKLWTELATIRFRSPQPPVVTNVEAAPNPDPGRIPELLRAQVTAPVRFTEMVRRLVADGVTSVLEVGPGRVMTGLVARIEARVERMALATADEIAGVAERLAST
jgi:[acyl-carrier-protein] S-malonyltransferase